MKISTEINSASKIVGEERAIEYIAKAGFDAWDFSMFSMCRYDWGKHCLLDNDHPLSGRNYLEFARKLKQTGIDNGIVCNQSHAPFPSDCVQLRSYFKRAIECTAEAGGEICVIHPMVDSTAEENAEMYFELILSPWDYAGGYLIVSEAGGIVTDINGNDIRFDKPCSIIATNKREDYLKYFNENN